MENGNIVSYRLIVLIGYFILVPILKKKNGKIMII